MSNPKYPVGIIGGGAWGTALAAVMAQIHDEVLIWAREEEVVSGINDGHENTAFLAGLKLSPKIIATGDLNRMADCGALLIVTPAQHVRATLAALPETHAPLLLCAKGIEADTQMLVSDIAAQVRPDNPIAVLSGPTFAHEVAAGKTHSDHAGDSKSGIGFGTDAPDCGSAFPALLVGRRYWRRDRWGSQKCARHRLRCCRWRWSGPQCPRCVDRAGFAEMQRYGMARGGRADTLAGIRASIFP